jgi:hypothetical protein
MAVIDHNTWSTFFTRRYYNESRKDTVDFIKTTLNNAIDHLKQEMNSDLIKSINDALQGFNNLKMTYADDNLIIGLIDEITENVKTQMTTLAEQLITDDDLRLIEDIIKEGEQEADAQKNHVPLKILSDEDTQTEESTGSSSLQEMVEISDREPVEIPNEKSIDVDSAGNLTENIDGMSNSNSIRIDNNFIKNNNFIDIESQEPINFINYSSPELFLRNDIPPIARLAFALRNWLDTTEELEESNFEAAFRQLIMSL